MRVPSLVTRLAFTLCLSAFALSVQAADAGTIEKLNGKVTIINAANVERVAAPRERIQAGDTVSTDAKSETMVKMADDTTVLVRPNTQFKVTEFKYDKA